MKMKLDNKQAVIEAATAGAKKYADEQLDLLRQFAGIDCGSRNEEGNRRVVEILDRLLEPTLTLSSSPVTPRDTPSTSTGTPHTALASSTAKAGSWWPSTR